MTLPACTCDPGAFETGPEGQRRYFPDRYCPRHGEHEAIAARQAEMTVREYIEGAKLRTPEGRTQALATLDRAIDELSALWDCTCMGVGEPCERCKTLAELR